MRKTIVLNLFAGPGAGKSTGACYIFSQLKMKGIDCEYVSEFAKDKVWEHNEEVLKCQFYISGKQSYKISRVYGKVDVIITDSPILVGAIYGDYDNPNLVPAIVYEFKKYNNVNIFLERDKPYNPNGRMQTEDEAKEKDAQLLELMKKYDVPYTTMKGNKEGYDLIVNELLHIISAEKRAECQQPFWAECNSKKIKPKTETFGRITSDFLEALGLELVLTETERCYRMVFDDEDVRYNFSLTWNRYDDKWIYSDYRNRVFGVESIMDLEDILRLAGIIDKFGKERFFNIANKYIFDMDFPSLSEEELQQLIQQQSQSEWLQTDKEKPIYISNK